MSVQVRAAAEADLQPLLDLLQAYYEEFSIEVRDSDDAVLASLAGAEPGYLIAEVDGTPAGCVLLRRLASIADAAECKRLFVRPEHRGLGLGGQLMAAAERLVQRQGFVWLYLDSMPVFATAVALYERRGYESCARFNDNPQATLFLRKRLTGMA